MKTIFFVIATKPRINFILRTELFNLLKKDYRLVIVSPFGENLGFKKEFGGENVVFEPISGMTKLASAINNWRNQELAISHPVLDFANQVHSRWTPQYHEKKGIGSFLKMVVRRFFLLIVPRFLRKSPSFWDRIEAIFSGNKECSRLFKKYDPTTVIVASAGAEGNDIPFVVYGKKFGVPVFAVDSNIDVFEYRYFSTPRTITKWLLFSEAQKRQAMEIQKISENLISVTGPIRYDYYHNFKPMSREEFFKKVGADPKKKLITYGAKVPKMYPYNREIMEAVLAEIKGGKYGDAQLFVRFDPGHDPQQYGDLLKEIVWQRAEEAASREDVANLLYYSDVVFSIGSTFCIESCLLNKPSLWVGFSGKATGLAKEDSYRIMYDLDLMKRILATGGIPLAENLKELTDWIGKYLKNPELDTEKRRALIEQEYFKTDGKAGERAAEVIKNLIS